MGKRPWTTKDQRAWLVALIPEFTRAQHDRTTLLFFAETYSKWYKKWPATVPTEEEIEKAEGNTEGALAKKQKFMENRIKTWFHNNTRASSSGAGTRGVLNLGPSAKAVQSWQAYLNKFQNTKLKPEIDDAWQEYLNEVPEGVKPEKTKFEIRNHVARKLFAAETATVKQEVEEHRQKMMSRNATSDLVERNQSFQTFHQGTTPDGQTFEDFLGGDDKLKKKILLKFDRFLREAFDEEECASRALNVGLVGDSDENEDTSSDSNSEYDGPTKSRVRPSTSPAKSERELEMERARAKRIEKSRARNKRMLLDLQKNGRVDPKYMQGIDEDPNEDEEGPEEEPNADSTIGSSDSQAPPFPSLTTRSQAATDTGSGTSENVGAPLPSATESPTDTTASKSLAIPSANNVCCDAGSSASENVGSLGTQVSSSTASPTAGTTVPKASAALSADNACRDAGSNASENVGPQVPSSTASPTADTTVSKSLEAPSADNASRIASPGTSENVGAQILDATESSTAGAMSASLTTSPADANNACCDAGSGTSKNLNGTESAQDGAAIDTGVPQEGTSSVPFNDVSASVSDASCMNTWFAPWLEYFRDVSTSALWNALVTKWVEYELLNPPKGRLSTEARPEEVQIWISRKKLVTGKGLPKIKNPSEFGVTWMAWWVTMQPPWRKGESLVKTLPADGDWDWEPILRGGSNGLSMVVAALSWWVSAMGSNNQHGLDLMAAIEDVSWVLSELVTLLSAAGMEIGKKRSVEEASKEEPKSKRARTLAKTTR